MTRAASKNTLETAQTLGDHSTIVKPVRCKMHLQTKYEIDDWEAKSAGTIVKAFPCRDLGPPSLNHPVHHGPWPNRAPAGPESQA